VGMGKNKILIVDDEPDFVNLLRVRLEANGYEVIDASNGEEGFKKAEAENPDIILLDIIMPDMNGYQICEQLKQEEKTRNIPIILITGKELEPRNINERCLKLGVEGFLSKPLDSKELLDKIRGVLKGR
jgi:CheY-like chemotaxis protein